MKKYNSHFYQAEFSCPQCGAPALLDETEYAVICRYCRTGTLLIPENVFHYYFPPGVEGAVFYVPYWRLRGAYFHLYQEKNVLKRRTKFMDTTVLALSLPHLPYSLGVRTHNLALKPVAEGIPGLFLKAEFSMDQVRAKVTQIQSSGFRFRKSFEDIHDQSRAFVAEQDSQNVNDFQYFSNLNACLDARAGFMRLLSNVYAKDVEKTQKDNLLQYKLQKEAGQSAHFQAFIGEMISLLYYPFILENGILMDGVRAEPLSRHVCSVSFLEKKLTDEVKKTWKPLPLICPGCGWTLSGASDSLLFTCANCGTSWLLHDNDLRKCAIFHVAPETEKDVFLPFWRLEVSCPGFRETLDPDQIKRQFIWEKTEKGASFFKTKIWTPALRLLPDAFLCAAVKMNMHAGKWALKSSLPSSRMLYPATLPLTEAVESVVLVLCEMTVNQKKLAPFLKELQISASEARIVFIPFQKRGAELVAPGSGFAVRHTAIRDRTGIEDLTANEGF